MSALDFACLTPEDTLLEDYDEHSHNTRAVFSSIISDKNIFFFFFLSVPGKM